MKVLAGSWGEGSAFAQRGWTGGITGIRMPGGLAGTLVPADEVVSVTQVTNENKTSVVGKAGWGIAGGLLLGPVGALAGILGGGNKQRFVVAIEFTGDRRALVDCDPDDFKRLMAMAFNRAPALSAPSAPSASPSATTAPATYSPAPAASYASAAPKRPMGTFKKVLLGAVVLIIGMGILGAIVGPQNKDKSEGTATAQPASTPPPASNEERILVPSDPKAEYFVMERAGDQAKPILTTRRVGPSGTSFTRRMFDCKAKRVQDLADGDTWDEFKASSKSDAPYPLVEGSIADVLWNNACASYRAAKPPKPAAKPRAPKKPANEAAPAPEASAPSATGGIVDPYADESAGSGQ